MPSGGFQSAPLTEAREICRTRRRYKLVLWFQSAPLTEARGDPVPGLAFPRRSGFQSAPSPKQGEIPCSCRLHERLCFNPLPHRSKGRFYQISPNRRQTGRFNPLPHRSKGRSVSWASCKRDHFRFNPLPSPKQGEIARDTTSRIHSRFNRSPHRSKGRCPRIWCRYRSCGVVSIRSPHRSKGRFRTGGEGK